jgi:predicted secreted acid phosphatase
MIKKQKAIIFDIDGTLLDDSKLKPYMPKDKFSKEAWTEFRKHYNLCTVNQPIAELVKMYSKTHKILFITAREDVPVLPIRKESMEQIKNAIGDNIPFELYMRKYNDYSDDAKVKAKIYKKKIQDNYNIELIVDNSKEVIKKFHKKFGIMGLRVYGGN